MIKITIDHKLCKKCGLCVLICPEGVLVQKRVKTFPKVVRIRLCSSCGHCVDICTSSAISHSDFERDV